MVPSILKGINPKVNVIAQLEFELSYYDITVQHVSHYTTRTSSDFIMKWLFIAWLFVNLKQ